MTEHPIVSAACRLQRKRSRRRKRRNGAMNATRSDQSLYNSTASQPCADGYCPDVSFTEGLVVKDDVSIIPNVLLWLPYTAFSIALLGLMLASFVHFHSRRGHKYRQRREQFLRQIYVQELLRQHAQVQAQVTHITPSTSHVQAHVNPMTQSKYTGTRNKLSIANYCRHHNDNVGHNSKCELDGLSTSPPTSSLTDDLMEMRPDPPIDSDYSPRRRSLTCLTSDEEDDTATITHSARIRCNRDTIFVKPELSTTPNWRRSEEHGTSSHTQHNTGSQSFETSSRPVEFRQLLQDSKIDRTPLRMFRNKDDCRKSHFKTDRQVLQVERMHSKESDRLCTQVTRLLPNKDASKKSKNYLLGRQQPIDLDRIWASEQQISASEYNNTRLEGIKTLSYSSAPRENKPSVSRGGPYNAVPESFLQRFRSHVLPSRNRTRRRLVYVANMNGSMVNVRCGQRESLDTFASAARGGASTRPMPAFLDKTSEFSRDTNTTGTASRSRHQQVGQGHVGHSGDGGPVYFHNASLDVEREMDEDVPIMRTMYKPALLLTNVRDQSPYGLDMYHDYHI